MGFLGQIVVRGAQAARRNDHIAAAQRFFQRVPQPPRIIAHGAGKSRLTPMAESSRATNAASVLIVCPSKSSVPTEMISAFMANSVAEMSGNDFFGGKAPLEENPSKTLPARLAPPHPPKTFPSRVTTKVSGGISERRDQSAGIPAARKGCGGKQGGMLLPDIPPQSPSLLFGLHFLVDMSRSGKEEIQQHPGDGGKPDAARGGTSRY